MRLLEPSVHLRLNLEHCLELRFVLPGERLRYDRRGSQQWRSEGRQPSGLLVRCQQKPGLHDVEQDSVSLL